MSRPAKNQYVPDSVSPPGDTLFETIAALGMSQSDVADRMGRAKKTINEIIKGKAPITPTIALELERVLGVPAEFWNTRERLYREAVARDEERERLHKSVGWLKQLPVSAMTKNGWVKKLNDKIEQIKEMLNFFGIASPEQWESLIQDYEQQISFRKSTAFECDHGALIAWLRKGEIEALEIHCAPYDGDIFKKTLQEVRALTRTDPEVFQPELVRLCAQSGVAIAFVPELPKTRMSGATRWLTPKKALVQLSLRYKTDDHLWFTFFHEAAHILLHGKKKIFLEGKTADDHDEQEANRYAMNVLISEADFRRFIHATARPGKGDIEAFALQIGISPGIVVGRLQYEKILLMNHCNELKRRFDWAPGVNDTGSR